MNYCVVSYMFFSSLFGQECSRSHIPKTIVLRRWILLEGFSLCRRPFPGDPEHESADFDASPTQHAQTESAPEDFTHPIFYLFSCFSIVSFPLPFVLFSSHQACACTDAFFLCRHPDHPRLPRLPQRQRRVFTELGHYPSRQLLVKTKEASCAARNTICHERGSCDGLLAVFRVCVPFSFEFTQFS